MGAVEFKKSKIDIQFILNQIIDEKLEVKLALENEIEDLKQQAFKFRILQFYANKKGFNADYTSNIRTIYDSLPLKGQMLVVISTEIDGLTELLTTNSSELIENLDSFSDLLQKNLVSRL
jgi:hypothetical protein